MKIDYQDTKRLTARHESVLVRPNMHINFQNFKEHYKELSDSYYLCLFSSVYNKLILVNKLKSSTTATPSSQKKKDNCQLHLHAQIFYQILSAQCIDVDGYCIILFIVLHYIYMYSYSITTIAKKSACVSQTISIRKAKTLMMSCL